MGLLFSKKKPLSKKDVLEDLENIIAQLSEERRRNVFQEKSFVGYLLILSLLFYLIGAIVFYIYYSPRSWVEYILYSIPLVLFPIIVYLVKKLLNMYFAHKKAQYDEKLLTLQAEKRKVLDEVTETETFKVARELLLKYDPNHQFLRELRMADRHRDATSATSQQRQRRENGGGGGGGGQLRQRQRGGAPHTPHPALRHQQNPVLVHPQTVPRLATRPHPPPPPPQAPLPLPAPPTAPPHPSNNTTNAAAQETVSTATQLPSHHTSQFIPPGMCLGPAPGPPAPTPILPRDRTSLDKMVEYLVGDGPNNRYALICSYCHSHNGMSLSDEFEFISFRCAYCFTFNPARRKKKPSLLTRRPSTSAATTNDENATPVSSGVATETGAVGEVSEGVTETGIGTAAEGGVEETEPREVEGQPPDPEVRGQTLEVAGQPSESD